MPYARRGHPALCVFLSRSGSFSFCCSDSRTNEPVWDATRLCVSPRWPSLPPSSLSLSVSLSLRKTHFPPLSFIYFNVSFSISQSVHLYLFLSFLSTSHFLSDSPLSHTHSYSLFLLLSLPFSVFSNIYQSLSVSSPLSPFLPFLFLTHFLHLSLW